LNVPLRELHLFAGAGGGILGGLLLGHVPVCAVELEEYPRSVLLQRQRDGLLPWFPVWDDVCTFDGNPWRGRVDLVAGGFPCQDISAAGKGAGITGARSGLWSEFARILGEVKPSFCFIENSPLLRTRGLEVVLEDLAALGFDAEWGIVGAYQAGAPHKRDRMWVLAHAPGNARDEWGTKPAGLQREARLADGRDDVANPHRDEQHGRRRTLQVGRKWGAGQTPHDGHAGGTQWSVEPGVGLLAHGVARRVDRLKAIGNGQVPQVAALAWRTLMRRLTEN